MTLWTDYAWIVVVGCLAAFFTAYGIGANDVANAFGSSVAARTLSMRQALLIAAVCEFGGSVLLGGEVTRTVASGIASLTSFERHPEMYMYGMLCAMVSSGTWLIIATYLELPVSTTHSIAGAVLGFAFVYGGPKAVIWLQPQEEFPYMRGMVPIVVSWFISPLLSGLAAALLFFIVRTAILRREASLELAFWALPLLVLITVFINSYFVLYKGADTRITWSSNKSAWVSACIAGGCTVLTVFVGMPLVRQSVYRDVEARRRQQLNEIENHVQNSAERCSRAAGGGGRASGASHPATHSHSIRSIGPPPGGYVSGGSGSGSGGGGGGVELMGANVSGGTGGSGGSSATAAAAAAVVVAQVTAAQVPGFTSPFVEYRAPQPPLPPPPRQQQQQQQQQRMVVATQDGSPAPLLPIVPPPPPPRMAVSYSVIDNGVGGSVAVAEATAAEAEAPPLPAGLSGPEVNDCSAEYDKINAYCRTGGVPPPPPPPTLQRQHEPASSPVAGPVPPPAPDGDDDQMVLYGGQQQQQQQQLQLLQQQQWQQQQQQLQWRQQQQQQQVSFQAQNQIGMVRHSSQSWALAVPYQQVQVHPGLLQQQQMLQQHHQQQQQLLLLQMQQQQHQQQKCRLPYDPTGQCTAATAGGQYGIGQQIQVQADGLGTMYGSGTALYGGDASSSRSPAGPIGEAMELGEGSRRLSLVPVAHNTADAYDKDGTAAPPGNRDGETHGEGNVQWQNTFDQLKAIVLHGTQVNVHDAIFEDPAAQRVHSLAEVFDPATEDAFKYLQVLTAICDSFSHGANDVANSVGPFTAIWFIYRFRRIDYMAALPIWILVLGGAGIVMGLATYGYNIIRAIGVRLSAITPSRGFCIELSTALVVALASKYGLPISTTHCQVGATAGMGLMEGSSGLNWRLSMQFFAGWVVTLLLTGLMSAALFAAGAYAPCIQQSRDLQRYEDALLELATRVDLLLNRTNYATLSDPATWGNFSSGLNAAITTGLQTFQMYDKVGSFNATRPVQHVDPGALLGLVNDTMSLYYNNSLPYIGGMGARRLALPRRP